MFSRKGQMNKQAPQLVGHHSERFGVKSGTFVQLRFCPDFTRAIVDAQKHGCVGVNENNTGIGNGHSFNHCKIANRTKSGHFLS
jgi:hypothetical protein